jgi:hypothetical protein
VWFKKIMKPEKILTAPTLLEMYDTPLPGLASDTRIRPIVVTRRLSLPIHVPGSSNVGEERHGGQEQANRGGWVKRYSGCR